LIVPVGTLPRQRPALGFPRARGGSPDLVGAGRGLVDRGRRWHGAGHDRWALGTSRAIYRNSSHGFEDRSARKLPRRSHYGGRFDQLLDPQGVHVAGRLARRAGPDRRPARGGPPVPRTRPSPLPGRTGAAPALTCLNLRSPRPTCAAGLTKLWMASQGERGTVPRLRGRLTMRIQDG